ncbi:hypothetical protein K469DRAFT_719816 [Zopfia rhizophila CBS 207.26]|uniref:Uncharacterized protein n=1 Tax=Zopfia rhizophila CBS 207.26 TaxID=1314779 RepID=A0A6A6DIT7_9PEZI|nr:hypothetical protein K469DRAFT_719816 [Zopfia rhizophila CBS 207.26]
MIDSTRGRQTRSQALVPNTQSNNPSSTAPATPAAQRLTELQIQNQIEELEHQQRMRQKAEEKADEEIRALRRTNNSTPGTNEGDDKPIGERFSLQVLEVVQQVPGISPKDIHLILQHKFEAENLTRLRNDFGAKAREDSQTAEFDQATRQLTVKRVRGSIKYFGDNTLIWIECFTNYTRIIGLLFNAEHPLVLPAMLHFMARVIRHSHAYGRLSVLQFALGMAQIGGCNVSARSYYLAEAP